MSWTSPATGVTHHGWSRGRRVGRSLPEVRRWTCAGCGSSLEKSDLRSGYPDASDLASAGIGRDCAEHAVRAVMES